MNASSARDRPPSLLERSAAEQRPVNASSAPIAAITADGTKLHLQHGPIDLIITADGQQAARREAFEAAEAALQTVLIELVSELATLRRPASNRLVAVGPVARRMITATAGYGELFVTPMAAVAGAVADHIVAAVTHPDLDRLIVNNGGDIAFALAPGQSVTVGLVGTASEHRLAGDVTVRAADPIRGVATSGWRGRSHSLGIADTVTVLAADAAAADAAASVIASAVDLPGHPAIARFPARALREDSDLGVRLVTVAVGDLRLEERRRALSAGAAVAERLAAVNRIAAAFLVLGDQWIVVGDTKAIPGDFQPLETLPLRAGRR